MLSAPDKISSFNGNNAIGAREHWDTFMEYIIDTGICHLDVLLRCFALSLKRDARKWFQSLLDNNIDSIETCQTIFFDKWMEKKYVQFLL